MEWMVITVLAGFGFWTWRQRNAFRLRAYLLEQKYIHGVAVDRAIAAQLGRDRLELAVIGTDPLTTDLLGRRESAFSLERQTDMLEASLSGSRRPAAKAPVFPARGEAKEHPAFGMRAGAAR